MNARTGSGSLAADFGAKAVIIPRRVPLREHRWFRRLVLGGCTTGLLLAIVTGALAYNWRRTVQADLAAQRRSLDAFLHSGEFSAFVRVADAQFVAAINFAALRPREVAGAFPALAAHEAQRHELPWSFELRVLPISVAAEPGRVMRAGREAGAVLARRDWRPGETDLKAARALFLRLLAPHTHAFLQRQPGNGFNALQLDRAMQDEALAAFAAQHGPDVSRIDVEQLFCFYAVIGPALWQAIERERGAARSFGPLPVAAKNG